MRNTLLKFTSEMSNTYRSGENKSITDFVLMATRDENYLKNVNVIPSILHFVSIGLEERSLCLLKDAEVER